MAVIVGPATPIRMLSAADIVKTRTFFSHRKKIPTISRPGSVAMVEDTGLIASYYLLHRLANTEFELPTSSRFGYRMAL